MPASPLIDRVAAIRQAVDQLDSDRAQRPVMPLSGRGLGHFALLEQEQTWTTGARRTALYWIKLLWLQWV
jgi:hypothetical protein